MRTRVEAWYPSCTSLKVWLCRVEGRERYGVKLTIDLNGVEYEISKMQMYVKFYINPSILINFGSHRVENQYFVF